MKVYELIQELTRYNADDEVQFHVTAKYSADVEAEFDREDENDTQDVTVDVEFDEDVEFENMSNPYYDKYKVVIDLKY